MRRMFLTLIAVAMVAAGCRGGESEPQMTGTPDPNATVKMAGEDLWGGLGAQSSHFAFPLNLNVYEPLIFLKPDYTLDPGLAEKWEPTETGWRFHLRKGVTFHDGHPLNADDVVWSLGERMNVGRTLTTLVRALDYDHNPEAVRKVDDLTVDINPAKPDRSLPEELVHPLASILPKGHHFFSEPASGTGPFKVAEYRTGEFVRVERYDGYWGAKAKVKTIEMTFIPNPDDRIEALNKGRVDFLVDLPPDTVTEIKENSKFRVVQSKPGRTQQIFLPRVPRQGGFDLTTDKAVREAVARAIDPRSYVTKVMKGNAEPGRWMAPRAVLGTSADLVKAVGRNRARAGQILDQAGWARGADGIRAKDGRRLTLTLIAWAEVGQVSLDAVRDELRPVGIETKFETVADQLEYRDLYNSGMFDLDLEVPSQNDANPAFIPVLRFASSSPATEYFAPGGSFDEIAARAKNAKDRSQAQQASAEMMRVLINEEYEVVPLAALYRIYAMKKSVNLGEVHPSQPSQRWTTLNVTKTK